MQRRPLGYGSLCSPVFVVLVFTVYDLCIYTVSCYIIMVDLNLELPHAARSTNSTLLISKKRYLLIHIYPYNTSDAIIMGCLLCQSFWNPLSKVLNLPLMPRGTIQVYIAMYTQQTCRFHGFHPFTLEINSLASKSS